MRETIVLGIFITLLSCKPKESKLSIEFNPNIATYSIVERLVADHQGRLFYIDGKADYSYLPMVQKAFDKYRHQDNSKIIESTLKYLAIVGNQQDLTYQTLVRSLHFPEIGLTYSFEGLNIDQEKKDAVKEYIQELNNFYLKNKLGLFFENNKDFIEGGINEIKKNVPDGYVEKMEGYYGETLLKFMVYPDAFNIVPKDESESDFFHGNGQQIFTAQGKIATMVTSPFLPIDTAKQSSGFGFDHPDYVKLIVTHEFGHSFVNHMLETVRPQLKKTETLFYSGLSEKMQPQGYSNWFICMAEHLVRLGEIRIAENMGEKARAEELRKMYINKFHFVLIPFLESRIMEYERNRDKYSSYKEFLPRLLSVLDNIRPKELRDLLGLPTETYRTTISLNVPNKEDNVFIVGNQNVLGNWNPGKIQMDKISDFQRTITLDLYSDTKFKFTKGNWNSEGNLKDYEDGQNIMLKIETDGAYQFTIREWKE